MVFFTCSVCGESVKKVSVEKHLLTSRRCNQGPLSCMDCGKDFEYVLFSNWILFPQIVLVLLIYSSISYKSHNACITEAAKYGGLNYKAPANANKGQQKQSEWTEVCVVCFTIFFITISIPINIIINTNIKSINICIREKYLEYQHI